MSTKRTLTKSRFKLGSDCATKLFYTNKKEYANRRLNDPFLQELANGGFQVGELAKQYFPGGVEVEDKDYETSLGKTGALLEQENVTIFEAAIAFENLFIRVDVLRKTGNRLDVIEVKSKSFDSTVEDVFRNKNGTISAGWKSYLYDIAFQQYVVGMAFPESDVSAYLMMADKSTTCPTSGLNQKFRVKVDGNNFRSTFVAGELVEEDLSVRILTDVNVDEICLEILENKHIGDGELGFIESIKYFAAQYEKDEKIISELTSNCGACEFRTADEDEEAGSISGFEECWKDRLGWKDEDFNNPTVLDIWNFRKKNNLLDEKRGRITEVYEDDISPKPDKKDGISLSERQWLQVKKAKEGDSSIWIDPYGLKREFARWKFPLHFIDFETSMAAIPFLAGHRPYEPIAFQFSHHIVSEDGTIRHEGEFLNAEPGVFPNFEFLRALKAELENDEGTVLRFAPHENTYLNHIWKQLMETPEEIEDRDDLIQFLKSITKSTGSVAEKWEGSRNMVDMLELVKRFYYDPFTNGSNSIKKVLPAIMQSSSYVREKYSKPVYGTEQIPSLNFSNMTWVEIEDGKTKDPYQLLPKMFTDVNEDDYDLLSENGDLGDGGAALAAYAKLQYEDMSDYERNEIKSALLRYCELDTLAMVMIYEGWREMLSGDGDK